MHSQPDLYLASQSPRRQAILRQIGVHFAVVDVKVSESHKAEEKPIELAVRLSQEKATAGLRTSDGQAPVMGADTIVVVDQQILGKPLDFADAKAMLTLLSGRSHQVVSAVSITLPGKIMSRWSTTDVVFRQLAADEIACYWHTGEPQDKAGSYGIQGLGAVFVQRIAGSYSGVVGLPIAETTELLQAFSIPWWRSESMAAGAD